MLSCYQWNICSGCTMVMATSSSCVFLQFLTQFSHFGWIACCLSVWLSVFLCLSVSVSFSVSGCLCLCLCLCLSVCLPVSVSGSVSASVSISVSFVSVSVSVSVSVCLSLYIYTHIHCIGIGNFGSQQEPNIHRLRRSVARTNLPVPPPPAPV